MTTDQLPSAPEAEPNAIAIAGKYVARGWRVVPIPPKTKAPRVDGWERLRILEPELHKHFRPNNNIGVLNGEPSGWLVDVDLDHPVARQLADRYLPATCSEFGRPSSPRSHRLYRVAGPVETQQRRLPKVDGKAQMIVELRSTGSQTVFPGSTHPSGERIEWEADGELTEVEPGLLIAGVNALADAVEQQLGISRRPELRNGHPVALPADVGERARKYLAKIPAAVSGQGGHDQTFHAACKLVQGFALERGPALSLLAEWNQSCQPPWSDHELEHKIDSALKQSGERGYLLNGDNNYHPIGTDDCGSAAIIANFTTIEKQGADGKPETFAVPKSMETIIGEIKGITNGWPRKIDNMLFVDDEHGISYFDRRTVAGLFGFLRQHAQVKWNRGGDFASQGEVFAEYERTAARYDAIELLPHHPSIAGIYYRCTTPRLGDGSHLSQFLDRFRPETTIDRDLIQAALMTFFWGGPPGCRPAFVITADEGRGVGKTALAKSIGEIVNGALDVSVGEDIQTFKTRLLSPMARTARCGLCDNVKTMRFSWAEFEALITSPTISGKQMYVGEGRRPNLLTWMITLNGVSLATDMAQRSVIIKLARGKNDGPWLEETTKFIHEHRQQIIGDILAALQAKSFPLADYTRWATWEKDILSRLPEPAEAQRVIIERQGEANSELDEAEIVEQHFSEQLRKLGYDPITAQVRIPVATAARWFGWATGETTKTATASKRLNQLWQEKQSQRIAPDKSRTYGRCFVWTGAEANIHGVSISNDLQRRIAELAEDRQTGPADSWDA